MSENRAPYTTPSQLDAIQESASLRKRIDELSRQLAEARAKLAAMDRRLLLVESTMDDDGK